MLVFQLGSLSYEFPDDISIREVALLTKRDIEGKKDVLRISDDISDEALEREFPRSVAVNVKTAQALLKKYGGKACTYHFDENNELFWISEAQG